MKIVLMIVPQDYKNNINKIERILVMSLNYKILLDEPFNCQSFLALKKLLFNAEEIITYNGFTQYNILKEYNLHYKKNWHEENIDIYDKILNLMEEFAEYYQEYPDWDNWDFYMSPRWQKLKKATNEFNYSKQKKYDDLDPIDNIKATIFLYHAMLKRQIIKAAV